MNERDERERTSPDDTSPDQASPGETGQDASRRRSRDDLAAKHPDLQADLRERADGANAEQITDEANLRADPDPPD